MKKLVGHMLYHSLLRFDYYTCGFIKALRDRLGGACMARLALTKLGIDCLPRALR